MNDAMINPRNWCMTNNDPCDHIDYYDETCDVCKMRKRITELEAVIASVKKIMSQKGGDLPPEGEIK